MPDRARHDTLARQWELLRLIPSRPPGRTAGALTQSLADSGFPTSKRTVERDLKELERIFPIRCNDRGAPYGWHWMRDADLGIPGVELAEALSLTLMRGFLQEMLPLSLWRAFVPRLEHARGKLKTLAGRNNAARWPEKVRNISPTLPLLPPAINEKALACVQQALLEDRQLEVSYRGAGDEAEKSLTLHPLGLILRGPVMYLIATAFDYEDIRFYAVHRIRQAGISAESAKRPEGFSLDEYLAEGAGHFLSSEPVKNIRLQARVSQDLAHVLKEARLSEDMKLRDEDEYLRLTATLPDTWQLRWWILSQGARIEVLKPVALRKAIAAEISAMHRSYSQKNSD
ncbi:MAG: helix-turn-helix transcriptional regulator [Gammaproteobacteria bacterium]